MIFTRRACEFLLDAGQYTLLLLSRKHSGVKVNPQSRLKLPASVFAAAEADAREWREAQKESDGEDSNV
jgi:hypothetical protein